MIAAAVRNPILLIALFCVACSGSTDPADNFDGAQITLTADNRFSSADITIDPGTTVRWVSATSLAHTVTPDDPTQPGVWARATSNATGTVLTHTFTVPGETYTYHCEPHLADGMTGTIRVR